jgi:drug/metabolite transporter (DMT)-like permease
VTALLALFASVFWGTADFGGGLLSRRLPVAVVVLASQMTGLVTLTIGLAVPGVHVRFGGYLVYGLLAGVLSLIGLFAFYQAMARSAMSLVAPIAACGTAIPVVYAFIRGEKVTPLQGLGISVALVGVVLVSGPELRADTGGGRTILLALVAAGGFGSLFLFFGLGAPRGVYGTMFAEKLAGFVILLPCLFMTEKAHDLEWTRRMIGLSIFVGLADVGASTSFLAAAHSGDMAVVSVLGSLYPVVTTLMARRLLAERLRFVQQIGVITALGGVVLINTT